jgi:hypothetical protein
LKGTIRASHCRVENPGEETAGRKQAFAQGGKTSSPRKNSEQAAPKIQLTGYSKNALDFWQLGENSRNGILSTPSVNHPRGVLAALPAEIYSERPSKRLPRVIFYRKTAKKGI